MKISINIDDLAAGQVAVAFVQNEPYATLRTGQHANIDLAEGDRLHIEQMSAAAAEATSRSEPDEAAPTETPPPTAEPGEAAADAAPEPEGEPQEAATPEAELATPSGLSTEPGDVPPEAKAG